METRLRTAIKGVTWQLLGLVTTAALVWFHTGTLAGAFTFAASAGLVGFVMYFLHERVWSLVTWGRPARADKGS